MVIGHIPNPIVSTNMLVTDWKINTDEHGDLEESFQGTKKVEQVKKHKYVGVYLEDNLANNETFS